MLYLWKKILQKIASDKNYRNVKDHSYVTGKYRNPTHSICDLIFNVPNEIPEVFHNESNYDNHFITKELVNRLEGQF